MNQLKGTLGILKNQFAMKTQQIIFKIIFTSEGIKYYQYKKPKVIMRQVIFDM